MMDKSIQYVDNPDAVAMVRDAATVVVYVTVYLLLKRDVRCCSTGSQE